MKPPQRFDLVLTTSIALDGDINDSEAWRENLAKRTMADDYEYVMYGKVYKFDESGGAKRFHHHYLRKLKLSVRFFRRSAHVLER